MTKKRDWVKVERARAWKPDLNESIEGFYVAREQRDGPYGKYLAHLVKTETRIYRVSGKDADDCFAAVGINEEIRVVCVGCDLFEDDEGKTKYRRVFDVYRRPQADNDQPTALGGSTEGT